MVLIPDNVIAVCVAGAPGAHLFLLTAVSLSDGDGQVSSSLSYSCQCLVKFGRNMRAVARVWASQVTGRLSLTDTVFTSHGHGIVSMFCNLTIISCTGVV